jgi:hypothetical protein
MGLTYHFSSLPGSDLGYHGRFKDRTESNRTRIIVDLRIEPAIIG